MKRYVLLFIFLYTFMNILAYIFLDNKFISRSNDYLQSKLESTRNSYNVSTSAFESYAQLIFKNNVLTDEVYEIIKYLPKATEQQRNYIREQLYSYMLPLYKDLKEDIFVRQLHFHLPDGRSFLRMHRPNKHSDPLFDVRPSIKEANTKLINVKGFEEGRIFNGYRYVFPLVFKDKHFGSVEISMSMNALISFMNKFSQSDLCFMIKKLTVSKKVFVDEMSNYQTSILSRWYLHDKAINHNYCTKKIANLLETIKNDSDYIVKLEDSLDFSTIVSKDGKIYTAIFLSMANTLNEKVAYIFSVDEDSNYTQLKLNFFTNLLLILIGSFAFLAIIFFVAYRDQYIKNQNNKLEIQVKKRTNELNESLEKEQNYIELLKVIKTIEQKIIFTTCLEEVFEFCVNHFTTLPSCIFTVISVNKGSEYLFSSDNCDKFLTNKEVMCEKLFEIVQHYNKNSLEAFAIYNDLSEIPEMADFKDIFAKNKIKTIIIIPLVEKDTSKRFGNIVFFNSQTKAFDQHEIQLFEELSKTISTSI